MNQPATPNAPLSVLLAQLTELQSHVSADIRTVEERLPELRRLGKAAQHRRGGAGSRDALKYELGSVLMMLGADQFDSKSLLGAFAHPILLIRWMGEASIAIGSTSFSDLLAVALQDPRRLAFCRQWGRVLGFRYRKPLYDESVTSFVMSGRTGPTEPWRRKDITDDQAALITNLADLLDEPLPDLLTRGEAFDWIYERGGNPEYWAEPAIPDEWKD